MQKLKDNIICIFRKFVQQSYGKSSIHLYILMTVTCIVWSAHSRVPGLILAWIPLPGLTFFRVKHSQEIPVSYRKPPGPDLEASDEDVR